MTARDRAPRSLPRALPIVGHLHRFLPDKLGFLSRAARCGSVVEFDLGGPTFLLTDPGDIRHVLVVHHRNFEKTPRLTSRRGRRLSGEGLLTSLSDDHLRQRRLLQPLFHREVVSSFADVILEAADRMLEGWQAGGEIDVAEESMRWAQWTMGRALFGVDYFGEARELGAAIALRRRYTGYVFGSLAPAPEALPLPLNLAYRRAMKRIDRAVYGMIAARRGVEDPPPDFLTLLLQARYEDGSGMDDRAIRDEALTFAITGYETIGEALAWTWYLLARNPDAESTLRHEVDAALEGRAPGPETVADLRYTERVLEESMRLYPPTWIFVRIASKADRLPSGARVPAGAKLYLCPFVVHRDPELYPDPERFDPERFSDAAKRERPKLAYFPFGAGPRVCIGEPLARLQGVMVLARVAQRFRLDLVPGQRIEPAPEITLRPRHGIRMRPRARRRSPAMVGR